MADVSSTGVRTAEGAIDAIRAAEDNCPEAAGAPPMEVWDDTAVVVGKAEDMIDPEQSDTKLVRTGILPGLDCRL